jgi:uncharacterized protein (DUF952 family)
MMMKQTILKIMTAAKWREFQDEGLFRGAQIDISDGFIHLSYVEQLAETAMKHFAGQAELFVVAVDSSRLGTALRAEPSRGGQLFPHLYAPLSLDAVLWVTPLVWGADGQPAWQEP